MNNPSIAVFLLNEHVRAILCTYEADKANVPAERIMFKTFDPTIKADDFVVVPTDTRHKMTVCKVVAVDAEVNFDSSCQVQWIIGRVDSAAYEVTLSQEGDMLAAVRSAERLKKQRELKEAMFADSEAAVKALPIASIGAPPAIPAADKAAG